MRVLFVHPVRFGAMLLAFMWGCSSGGGSGGIQQPPPATVLARLQASLSGANEATIVDPAAHATVLVDVKSDGRLDFAVAGQASFVGQVSSLDVRQGTSGTAGPSVADLLSTGAVFDTMTSGTSGSVQVDSAVAAQLASTPGDYYVDIRTTGAPSGLARGQLAAYQPTGWHATLLGSNETTVVDAQARGGATVLASAPDSIDFVLAIGTQPITDITAAHVHAGAAGTDGGILLDFGIPNAALDAAKGVVSGSVSAPMLAVARIANDPMSFYVNAHTAAATGGLVRGQLDSATANLFVTLRGDAETTVADPNARGGATLEFRSLTKGFLTIAVPSDTQNINDIDQAHIDEGSAGINGGVLIDLLAAGDLNTSPATGSADATMVYTPEDFARILADPAGFYVNFESLVAPNGFARGQITDVPPTVFADLKGSEESIVVDPSAAGAFKGVFLSPTELSYTLRMSSPSITDVFAAHIHQGAAGVEGVILIDLLSGNFTTSGDTITGQTSYTGRTLARVLASPELFYVNAHTNAAPGGVARGQLQHLSGDVPPAGLTYTSPVVYQTGSAITPNSPTSVGGAVTGYSVSPPLPAGLSLDSTTGVISGTPTATVPSTLFAVTAHNSAGDASFSIDVTVNVGAPANLKYTTPVTYVQGTAISPNSPSNSGGAIASYSVSPSLPAGLSLSTTSGVISGTPSVSAAAANYTVTGTNAAGSTTATINITVTATLQPPSNLSYATPVSYSTGTAITANSPTVSGGAVSTWAISPALPTGLIFSTSTGVISGTPSSVTTATTYTVTASNAAGSTTASVSIATPLGAPTSLSYSPSNAIGYVSAGSFTSMTPSSSGGTVSSYSVSPALPSGLSINSSTGVISGTPTSQSAQTNYTVTATNSAGSTTATVTITILP